MTSVVVVEDTSWFRAAACAVITATPGFDLAGSAGSATEAWRLLSDPITHVDLVLMDVDLGGDSGIDLTAGLTRLRPELRILLMSTTARADLPAGIDSCGAIGFLPKVDLAPAVLGRYTGVA